MAVLKKILDTITASSEEDVQLLLDIMNPSIDRQEMGEKYEKALGYNPVTYFDRKDMEVLFEDIKEESVPNAFHKELDAQKDLIIEEAMQSKYNIDDAFMTYIIFNHIGRTLHLSKLFMDAKEYFTDFMSEWRMENGFYDEKLDPDNIDDDTEADEFDDDELEDEFADNEEE